MLKQRLSSFEEKSEQLERLKGAKERIYLTTQEAVKTQAQTLVDVIHVNEQKILSDLENTHKTCMEQIAKEAENTEITAGNITSLYDFALSMTDCSQSLRLMAVYNHLNSRLIKMAEIKCAAIPSDIKYTHKFKPQECLGVGELSKLKLRRGKISTMTEAATSHSSPRLNVQTNTGEYIYSTQSSDELGSPRQFVDMYSFSDNVDNVFQAQAENVTNELFMSHGANINLLWKKHDLNSARDVAFLPDKSVVITEYQSRSEHIKLYDITGNLLSKTIPRGRLDWMRPWGIVGCNNSTSTFHITDQRNFNIRTLDRQLAVTRNIRYALNVVNIIYMIQVLILRDHKVPTQKVCDTFLLDSSMYTHVYTFMLLIVLLSSNICICRTNLEKPAGIALTREGHFIVTDTSSAQQNVSIIDQEGRTIQQWGRPGTGDNQFNNPEFIVTDSHGRILVSDNLNHCIKVFSREGQFLFKFNQLAQNNSTMCNPEGVTVDVNDNILVANGGNVSLFSKDGEFVCNFEMPSNRRRRLSFMSDDRSYGIALHQSGLLAVTAHSSLYVYNIPMLGY